MAINPTMLPQKPDSGSVVSNSQKPEETSSSFWGEDGFTFGDIIDAVNPLKHIPIVSNIYENFTESKSSSGSNLIGGALFGGVIGFIASFVNDTFEEITGKDVGGHMLALFDDNSATEIASSSVVKNSSAPISSVSSAANRYQAINEMDLLDINERAARKRDRGTSLLI